MFKNFITFTCLLFFLFSNLYSNSALARGNHKKYTVVHRSKDKIHTEYRKISEKQAIDRLSKDKDLKADSRKEAKALAKKVSYQHKPIDHEAHKNEKGYYPHIHPNGHVKNNSHIFYQK